MNFKRVYARNFMFRYCNVLENNTQNLVVLILDRLKKSVVIESCFSLSNDNILTVYIKVDKKINFKYQTPKLLVLEEYKHNPYDLKSVKNNEILELVRDLYNNDLNKGYFFTKNLISLITKKNTFNKL